MQHPGSITHTEPADMETDGVDSDDDNDVLKSDQVCLFLLDIKDVFFRAHLPSELCHQMLTDESFAVFNVFLLMHDMEVLCVGSGQHTEWCCITSSKRV